MIRKSLYKATFIFASIGFLLFTILFALSYVNPLFVENTAKSVIQYRLESIAHEKIDMLSQNELVNRAQQLLGQYQIETAQIRLQLTEGIPAKVAAIIAEMRNLDCECRRITEEKIEQSMLFRIGTLTQMQRQLTEFMQGQYLRIAEHLKREFRIFTGSSSFAFFVLLIAALIQRKAGGQFLLPAGLLFLSTVISAYFYIFQQNWLHTILFSSYVGFAYLGYIGVVFALLCDIIFNQSRIINVILNVLGNILSGLSALC